MKRLLPILCLILVFELCVTSLKSQCTCVGDDTWPTGTTSLTNSGLSQTINTAIYAGDSSIITNMLNGKTYKIAHYKTAAPYTSRYITLNHLGVDKYCGNTTFTHVFGGTPSDILSILPTNTSSCAFEQVSGTTFVTCVDCASAPANDDCVGALDVPVNAGTTCTSTTTSSQAGATQSSAACGVGTADDDIWFKFTATATLHNIKMTAGSSGIMDYVIEVLDGCGGSQILCSDNVEGGVNVTTVAGNTYYFRVYNKLDGLFNNVTMCITSPPPPPANDECAGALSVPVNDAMACNLILGTQSSQNATQSQTACVGTGADDDVWYKFTATNAIHKVVIQNKGGTSTDGVFQIFSGTCGSLTSLVCSDPDSATVSGLSIGSEYFMRVHTYGTGTYITFDICIKTPPPPPANDECAGAISVPVNDAMACNALYTGGSSQNATQSQTACVGTGADDDVWYKFTATNSTHKVVIQNKGGSSTDVVFQVFSGTCGSLTSLVCSDPDSATVSGLSIGSEYFMRVHTYGTGTFITFDICIKTPPPPPANDNCSGAVSLTAFGQVCGGATSGTTVDATQSIPGITCGGFTGSADDDVWYSFVCNNSTQIITVVGGTGFDAVVDLRSGACNGTNIGCADATGSGGTEIITQSGMTVGATYLVRVYSYGSGSGQGTFTICVTKPLCPAPTAQTVSNVTQTSADLNWTSSSTAWQIEWGATGFSLGTGTQVNVSAKPYTLSGLSPATAYDWYVRTDCGGGEFSTWTGPNTFTTQSSCTSPSALTNSNVTGNSAQIGWTENNSPPATVWDIYVSTTNSAPINSTPPTNNDITTNPYTITGLNGQTTYYVWVRSECGGGSTSSWSATNTSFTTLIDCSTAPSLTCAGSVTSGNLAVTGGQWSGIGACTYSIPGKEKLYQFTPTSTGVHQLNITSVNGGTGFIDYFYRNDNTCAQTGWTCIKDLSSVSKKTFGPLTSGTNYFIYLDAESAASTANHTFQIDCPYNQSYTSSTTTQSSTASVTSGTTNAQIIRLEVKVNGELNPLSMTQINFSTNGSTNASTDIAKARVFYTGTSTTFATTTQFGSDVNGPNGAFSVSGTQPITLVNGSFGDSTVYFWLVYDISCGAVNANVVDGECTGFTLGSTYTPTITAPTGTRTVSGFTAATNQPSTANVGAGTINAQVLRVDVAGSPACGNLTQLNLATTGSTNPTTDLLKARVFYTGTSTTFSTTTQFGTDINNPNGNLAFTGTQALAAGTNYFWLVYDVSCGAINNNVIDGECQNVVYNGTLTPTTPNPTGTRSITALSSYDTKANGNWNDPATWACSVPPTGTTLPINVNHNVTFDVGSSYTLNNTVTIAAGKSLNIGSNTLNIEPISTGIANLVISGTVNVVGTGVLNVGATNTAGTANITVNSGGTFNVGGGTATVGNSGGDDRSFTSNGTLTVTSGTLNVNGSISIVTGAFNQSGGNINIDPQGPGGNSTLTTLTISTPTIALTNGNITFIDPPTGTQRTFSYSSGTFASFGVGHTCIFGDGISSAAGGSNGFMVDGFTSTARCKLGAVTVNGGSGTNRFVQSYTSTSYGSYIGGTLTVNPLSELSDLSTGVGWLCAGDIVNNGTITSASTSTTLCFRLGDVSSAGEIAKSTSQTISGSGVWRNAKTGATANFSNLRVNNTSGTPIVCPPSMVTGTGTGTVSGTFTLTAGKLDVGENSFTLGVSTSLTGTLGAPSTLPSANAYIIGKFKRWNGANAGSRIFPVGTSGGAYGADFVLTASTAGTLEVSFTGTNPGVPSYPPYIDASGPNNYVYGASATGFWTATANNGLTSTNYATNLYAIGFAGITDWPNARVLKAASISGPWSLAGTHATGSTGLAKRTAQSGFSVFAVGQGQAQSPVELTSFTARAEKEMNKLEWITASEVNTAKFIVEKSKDGVSFKPIGEVAAAGVSNEPLTYHFMDEKPGVIEYYRLRMMDLDATEEYSNIVSVVREGKIHKGIIAAYPVPTKHTLTVEYGSEVEETAIVRIYDVAGKVLISETWTSNKGLNKQSLPLDQLSAGSYILELQLTDGTTSKRILKQ